MELPVRVPWRGGCTRLGATILLAGLIQATLAQQVPAVEPAIEFTCGGAKVVIDSEPKGFRSPEEAFVRTGKRVQASIVVTRGDATATFQSWRDIDFIGGSCMEDSHGNPRIVFRAFCGGSGCDGESNWGIIDPVALRELLVPGDRNTGAARALLGVQPVPGQRLISLFSGR